MKLVKIMEMDNKLKRAEALAIASIAGTEVLNGREEGRKIFDKIVQRLESLSVDTLLPISFEGVKFLDYSCADEIICRTVSRIRSRDIDSRFIIIQDASPTVEENILIALTTRETCCLLERGNKVEVIGKISEPLRETYTFALKKGVVTTGEVEKEFGLKVSACSNRLATLESMGLIYKVEEGPTGRGGKRYLFRVVS